MNYNTKLKMNAPKVTIIVPVYNVEKYLKCCVDSLLNQTLKDIEIILVDDDSPDNCPAICDEYAKQDHRVKVIHKKNEGQGYARNSAFNISTGEYIAFVDSDDYVELDAYQKLYSIITDTKSDVVYFNCQRFNDQGNIWNEISIRKEILYHSNDDIRGLVLDMIANPPKDKNDRSIYNSVWCALYRQDIIRRYGLKFLSERDFNGGEDMLFNIDFLLHSSKAIDIPDTFYNWRVNLSSYSRTVRYNKIDKYLFRYQYLLEILTANNFETEGYLRATRNFIGIARNIIRQYIQLPISKKEKMQWLKEIVDNKIWQDIAYSYPYWQLPIKYALHFYMLHNGYCRLLYYYSKL